MRQVVFFLLSLVLGVVLFTWVLRFVGWDQLQAALLIFSGPGGLAILGFTMSTVLCGAWRWHRILRWIGYRISFRELWPADFAYFAINFLVPQIFVGGEAFQGYFLNKKYNIPLEKAAASAIIERILELTWSAIVIIIGAAYFILSFGLPSKQLALIFGGVSIFLGAFLVFFYLRSFRKESIVRIFIKRTYRKNHAVEIEKEVFRFFVFKNKQLWQSFGLTALKGLTGLARAWLLILFLGKTVGILPAISVLGSFYLAMLLPIPAALGSHDILQTFVFGAMGLGQGTGAAFAMIIRGADLLIALLGLVLLFRLGLKLFEIALFEKAARVFSRREGE